MPIVLRIGLNNEHSTQEVHEGIENVLSNIKQDRYLGVRYSDGQYVCGGRIIAASTTDLTEIGISDNLSEYPIHLVMHCITCNEERSCLESEFQLIPWDNISDIFMTKWPVYDTYIELFKHFKGR